MRCFIAAWPDAATVAALVEWRRAVEGAGTARGVRWIEPDALHLTLRFLGPTTRAQIECLADALPRLAAPMSALPANGSSLWQAGIRRRLIVLELETRPRLAKLAAACEAEARKSGFSADTRAFRPHVTLARVPARASVGSMADAPHAVTFARLALVQSILTHPHASYRTLSDVQLVN